MPTSVGVVASGDVLLSRLPEALSPARVTVLICPMGSLLASTVSTPAEIRALPTQDSGEFIRGLVESPQLLTTLPEWVLWGDDMDLLRLARSPLPDELKLRVLPARKSRGMAILGSKTGLATLSSNLGLPSPASVVALGPDDLAPAAAALRGALMIKGERGSGAMRIRMLAAPADARAEAIPEHWYPVVVQEFVAGDEIAIDALFGHGRLLGWQYATVRAVETRFGRSTVRDFIDPAARDFVDVLQELAWAAGLHGFANCSFIRTREGRHLLIEADMRANAWHQFGPRLGVPWGELMGDPPNQPKHPVFGAGQVRTIHLYPRELVHAVETRSWSALRPWLTRESGTWDTRNHANRAVNRAERREILAEVAGLPARAVHRLTRRTQC